MDRAHLLVKLLEESEGVMLDGDGAAAGFALRRRFGRGQVIGPVVAPGLESAKAMIASLLDRHAGEFVRIDVPEESGLGAWIATAGLAEVGTVIRMVRGTDASAPRAVHSFGLASQAFG